MNLVLWSVAVRVTDEAGEHPDVVLDVCLMAETIDEAKRRAPLLARERVRFVRRIPRPRPRWAGESSPLEDERRLVATVLHASSIDDVAVSAGVVQQALFS